ATRDGLVAAMFEPGKLARIELATARRRDADFAGSPREVEIATGGRIWIATEQGELWRWDPDRAPVRIALTEPVDRRGSGRGGHLRGRGGHSVTALDGDAPRTAGLDARAVGWLGADYAAALQAHGTVAIVDVQTGHSVALAAAAITDSLVARDGAVMYATDR